jgi:hypothetical protein
LYFLRKKDVFAKFLTNKQLIAILYGALFFVRFLGGVPLIQSTVGLNVYSPFGPQGSTLAFVSIILFWLIYTVQLANVTFPFFEKNVPLVAPIVRYITPAVYVASIAALPILNRGLDGDLANGFHYRLLIFAIELGVGLALSAFQFIDLKDIKLGRNQFWKSILIFVGMFLISLPCWAPQALFGLGDEKIILEDLTIYHRLMIYGSVVFALIVHFCFKKCDYEKRRYALLYISMATMITFSYQYDFATLTSVASWPLHLCNTAAFLLLLGSKTSRPSRCIFYKSTRKVKTTFVSIADSMWGSRIGHTTNIVDLSVEAVCLVIFSHNFTITVTHNFNIYTLIARSGITIIAP